MMEIIYYIIEVRSNRVSKLNKTIALSPVHCFPFVSFPLFFSFLHVTSAIVEIIFIARRKWHAHLFAFWTFYSAPFIIIFWRVCAREREREKEWMKNWITNMAIFGEKHANKRVKILVNTVFYNKVGKTLNFERETYIASFLLNLSMNLIRTFSLYITVGVIFITLN